MSFAPATEDNVTVLVEVEPNTLFVNAEGKVIVLPPVTS
jgi:hypothetical protein